MKVFSIASNGRLRRSQCARSTSSLGACVGGVTGDGGYIDGSGNPTALPPACISLSGHPQSYVYALIAAIAILALMAVRSRQSRGLPGGAITKVAVAAMITVGLAFDAFHSIFFQNFLLGDWRGAEDIVLPFLSNLALERSAL